MADPWLWDTFAQAFLQAYTDMAKEEYAKRKLKNLQMKPGQLNNYIVEFDNLIQLTGWQPEDKSMVFLFWQGLNRKLHKATNQRANPQLATLDQWKDAVRAQQARWVEWTALFGGEDRQGTQPKWQQWLAKWQKNWHNSDQMDVNCVTINALTAEEKADCMKKGLCFFCKWAGHITKSCPKKKSNQNQQGKPKDQQKLFTSIQTTMLEQSKEDDKEVKDKDTRETLLWGVKNLSEEDREALFNELLKKEGF